MAPPPREGMRAPTAEEQAALERVRQATSGRHDQVRRATALLAVAQGQGFAAAGRRAGYASGSAVTALVRRFNKEGLAALAIAPGRGRRATYDPAARAQIVATAQRDPDRKRDGTATWSLSALQRTLRREALPAVGATTIRRVLRDAGSSSQQSRTWCPTGTAVRKRTSGLVVVVDPLTEQKRGASSRLIAWARRRACPCGVTMKPGRTRRSPRPERVGNRAACRCVSRTSTCAAGRSSG